MRRIFVTGGGGFIGTHLVERLALLGHHVTIFDAFICFTLPVNGFSHVVRQRRERLLGRYDIIQGDIRNGMLLRESLMNTAPDIVVHLAAVSTAAAARSNPGEAHSINIEGVAQLMEAVRRTGSVRRVVFASSSLVYGDFQYEPCDENHPLHPQDTYGSTKLAGENLVRRACRELGREFVLVRPSSVYGAGDSNGRITQLLVEHAILGRPVVLHGMGQDRLDFTHVLDAAEGIALAALREEAANEVFNITRGEARTLNDYATCIRNLVGEISMEVTPRAYPSPRRGTFSIARARRLLGFDPRLSLEEGLRLYVQTLLREGLRLPETWQDSHSLVIPRKPGGVGLPRSSAVISRRPDIPKGAVPKSN